ncbi:hypothetical protein JMJ35_000020 [Cladonia borealis]|uniref:Uncharacterized protein n=1 Tax=Cladonia borealis TaxID=184061 RepID=A0AA39R8L4_9LECA|nr:hypothetical protein JMJ35_000020 [Cladonia borealis]
MEPPADLHGAIFDRVVYTIMLQKPSIAGGASEQVHEGAAKGPRSWAMQGSKFSSSDLTRDEDHMNFFEEQWEQHFAGTTNEDVDENTLEHYRQQPETKKQKPPQTAPMRRHLAVAQMQAAECFLSGIEIQSLRNELDNQKKAQEENPSGKGDEIPLDEEEREFEKEAEQRREEQMLEIQPAICRFY